ncbi:hypothetical protein [Amycolatopsis sp. CA-230715]|uniref:hypothetical protein n=1 Tax=Amycolatopsis sp. CA-230715 TaxID=2745196 RepID=UPI001C01753B|nr:hypothetical protein [Amycolatopsis sp. CA-230715]QWF85149.1 hypothetical protein HUW46_08603 [Amycolatopsis sp. CA-230715]
MARDDPYDYALRPPSYSIGEMTAKVLERKTLFKYIEGGRNTRLGGTDPARR